MISNLPVPSVPTHNVHDGSKINSYLQCHRSYFYEYILGWRPIEPNNHLIFGDAYHLSMAHLMKNWARIRSDETCYKEIITDAYMLFIRRYREKMPVERDGLNGAKVPSAVMLSLMKYIYRYRFQDDFKVLHTEVAGTVPIDEDSEGNPILYHFRMDAIVEDTLGIYCLEHKTAGSFTVKWSGEKKLAIQGSGYTHALYMLYPESIGKVFGIMINGIMFAKAPKTLDESHKIDFQRVPIVKTIPIMNAWLLHVRRYMKEIKNDFELLSTESPSCVAMESFAPNPNHCMDYFGCPYHSFCMSWANPLQYAEKPPIGFTIEHWDPSDYEKDDVTVLKGGEDVT